MTPPPSLFETRFGPTGDEGATWEGARVCRRDVPSARGRVQQLVSRTSALVRWDGFQYACLESLAALERQA